MKTNDTQASRIPLRRGKTPPFMSKINEWRQRQRLVRAWAERNLNHGEILMESLELEFIPFNQNIFVQDSKELSEKLSRIGFEHLEGFPDEKLFERFSRIMYNKKHNVAISLFQPEHKQPINTAIKIAKESAAENDFALIVFLKAVNVLLDEQQPSTKKQVLLG